MQIVKPLSDGEVEKIHEASLDVLASVGVRVEHEELLGILSAAGAKVNETNGTVRLPPSLVRELTAQLPASHTICHPDGTEEVVENGSKHLLSGTIFPRVIDPETQRPRRPTMADLRRNIAVVQTLPAVRGSSRMDEPTVEEGRSAECLDGFEEYIVNNGKHVILMGESDAQLGRYLAIGQIISEAQDVPLSKLMTSSCPISTPLKMPQLYSEYLLQSCRAGFAIFGTISPTAGATGPYSLAGSLMLGNAENLFMAAASQIISPGIPFLYMYSPSVTDMRTGKGRFYSMDRSMARAALAQMGRFYNVPFLCDCAGSMPARLDVQTGAESMSAMLTACAADPAWLGAIGSQFNGLAFSAELLLIHAAWFEAAGFLSRGIRVDEQRLGADSIRRAGPGGDFLMDDLTLDLLHGDEFFDNDLFDMTGSEDGASILERAREKVDQMTADFESPLPHGLQEDLRRYFHDERKKGQA